jgi:hypothetical protein
VVAIAVGVPPVLCWFALGVDDPEAWLVIVFALIWGTPLLVGWWFPGWAAVVLTAAALLGVPFELFAAAWVGSWALFIGLFALFSALPVVSAWLFAVDRKRAALGHPPTSTFLWVFSSLLVSGVGAIATSSSAVNCPPSVSTRAVTSASLLSSSTTTSLDVRRGMLNQSEVVARRAVEAVGRHRLLGGGVCGAGNAPQSTPSARTVTLSAANLPFACHTALRGERHRPPAMQKPAVSSGF